MWEARVDVLSPIFLSFPENLTFQVPLLGSSSPSLGSKVSKTVYNDQKSELTGRELVSF